MERGLVAITGVCGEIGAAAASVHNSMLLEVALRHLTYYCSRDVGVQNVVPSVPVDGHVGIIPIGHSKAPVGDHEVPGAFFIAIPLVAISLWVAGVIRIRHCEHCQLRPTTALDSLTLCDQDQQILKGRELFCRCEAKQQLQC